MLNLFGSETGADAYWPRRPFLSRLSIGLSPTKNAQHCRIEVSPGNRPAAHGAVHHQGHALLRLVVQIDHIALGGVANDHTFVYFCSRFDIEHAALLKIGK